MFVGGDVGSGAARTLTRTRTRALALTLTLTCVCRRPRRRSRSCRHPAWCGACTAGAARGSGECHGPAAARAATHPSPNPSLSLVLTLAGMRGRAPSCRKSGPPRLAGLRCASRAGPCSTACSERAAARSKGTLGGVLKDSCRCSRSSCACVIRPTAAGTTGVGCSREGACPIEGCEKKFEKSAKGEKRDQFLSEVITGSSSASLAQSLTWCRAHR